jgi:rubrerythrin
MFMKHLKRVHKRIRGWLTKEDVRMLEEASKRVLKYPKNPAKKYGCDDCNYTWLYSSVKCPVCASPKTKNIV